MTRRPPDRVRLVALDLDGTVLDHRSGLSERMRRTVRAVADRGTQVVIATGRGPHSTRDVLRRIGITDGWAVCSNGAIIMRLDSRFQEGFRIERVHSFDATPVVTTLQEEIPGLAFAVEAGGQGYRLSKPFPPGELDGPQRVVSFSELCSVPATRVVARSWDHTAEEFLSLADRLGMHSLSYWVGWAGWLDIAPEGVTKAEGLEHIRQELQIAVTDTLAVGDGRNDLEMFAWAAWAVAMGQAVSEVRQAADQVTDSVDQDGAAQVLEARCLG